MAHFLRSYTIATIRLSNYLSTAERPDVTEHSVKGLFTCHMCVDTTFIPRACVHVGV